MVVKLRGVLAHTGMGRLAKSEKKTECTDAHTGRDAC